MRSHAALVLALLLTLAAPVCAQRTTGPTTAQRPALSGHVADTLVIDSRILGRSREVYVSLPATWSATTRPYPVLMVLDGEAYFTLTTTIEAQLTRLGHVPEAIVVAIPNATDDFRDRVHDMTPPGLSVSGSGLNEGGDDFLDFLEKELLPEIDRRYRGGKPRILVGHSSGGVIATWAAATRSAAFPVVVSIDAPIHLGDEFLAERLLERARQGGSEPVRYVSLESRFGWSDERWAELQGAAPPSWLLRREEMDGESHESMVFLSTYQGLKFAFSDYSIVGAPFFPTGTAMAVFDHFARIEELFDAPLPPPARVLHRLVEDLLIEGRVEPARRALRWYEEGYGVTGAQIADLRAQVEEVAARPPLTETVDDLKAAPWPTPADVQPYLGEWRGENWMNPDAPTPFVLRIEVVDGRVDAGMEFLNAPESYRHRGIEYLAVTPDGLDFGFMNGMRPAGMLVYEGKGSGDVLEGEERFRGIVLPLPGGHMPPTVNFRIARVGARDGSH